MGTDIPAVCRGAKVKTENKGGGNPAHPQNQRRFIEKEKFMGAHPDLQGMIFAASGTRSQQITNFMKVDERIKDLIGQCSDPYVLESIQK